MNQGKYIFSKWTGYLPQRVFDGFIKKYQGNRYVKHFTCWNQLLCMLFCQLTNRENLRDLIVALDAHSGKSYHLGLVKSVTRSNFAKANEVRSSRIFENFAYHLIAIARELHSSDDFKVKENIYAFNSSTIDLCLNVFWWAKFRKAKEGLNFTPYMM